MSYNGWKNYETWVVHLWLTNDQGSDGYWRERGRDAHKPANWSKDRREWLERGTFTAEETATAVLAEWLRDEMEEAAQDLLDGANASASMWADLLTSALAEVSWHDIAEAFLEE